MSRKQFSGLLIVSVVVAIAVLLMPGRTARDPVDGNRPLLPGLAEQVNEIDWLRISAAGSRTVVTLVRNGAGWTAEEANGYRADWPRLRQLLADLAEAEIVEAKTSNPAYYERLGVEGIGNENAGGIMIEFAGPADLPALIVGKTAQGRSGSYVRQANEAASGLTDREFNLPAERADWLDRQVIDLSDAEVLEIRMISAEGDAVVLERPSVDTEDFSLRDLPEGREIRSQWTLNAPANGLAGLLMDEVRPADALDWTGASQFNLRTETGLMIEASLLTVDPGGEESDMQHWIRLNAGLSTTAIGTDLDAEEGDAAVRERAETMNRNVNGWAYRIPRYKHDAMVKSREDLLQPLESP